MAHRYDLVIVGMGSGGMVAAEFAASTLGLHVAVVERGRVGGDCLWTGCVPSKALLASARAAHVMRHADRYGLKPIEPEIDSGLVWNRIRAVQDEIASSDDDPARYAAMGVDVVSGECRLAGPSTVTVTGPDGNRDLEARFILLCTGSRPSIPPIPGLEQAGFLTSESIFELDRSPRSITMIGGGPIAVEMAQAFARLGVRTTLLQKGPRILPRDEPELVEMLSRRLVDEGVDLRLNVETHAVAVTGDGKVVSGTENGNASSWTSEELLVATGRRPNIEGLGLEAAGVHVGPRGVEVDGRMRTSTSSIYAAGDVAGRFFFSHSAGYEGVRAVRDMFFPGKGTVTDLVPWCTFTDPELAHAGLTIEQARSRYGDDVDVWRLDLQHSDRARAESAGDGSVVIVTGKKTRVVGAHILAPAAGEMIHELALAIDQRLKLNEVAGFIHVYPTLSTAIGQLAAEAAFDGARRYRWLVRRERHRS